MEAVGVKVKITPDMVGKTAWILTEDEKNQVAEWGEYIAIRFMPGVDQRSLRQLNLYQACCGLVAEMLSDNVNFNTKKKVDRQCKFSLRFFDEDSKTHFEMKDGTTRLYFELGSISFDKLNRQGANEYFKDAFAQLGAFIRVTEEEIIKEAQSRMKARRICRICGTTEKIQEHHKLSQTKLYRALYPEYIDHPDNKIDYCIDCHDNKSIEKWNEAEFCKHFNIEIRSKSGQGAA